MKKPLFSPVKQFNLLSLIILTLTVGNEVYLHKHLNMSTIHFYVLSST